VIIPTTSAVASYRPGAGRRLRTSLRPYWRYPARGGRTFPDVRVVVTQPVAGVFKGFGIVCTHDGCELDGVSGGTINCPCHGSRFAITDGSVVQGPARSALRQETVAVHGDCIVLL
jgi:Rieske Fe-S protein